MKPTYVAVVALVLGLGGLVNASAAEFPVKPVRLLVGYSSGSAVDISARAIAEALASRFGQAVTVENRPGADQIVALRAVANAQPDGHTLVFGTSSMTLAPATSKAFKIDLSKDLTPVALLIANRFVVTVSGKSRIRSIEELVSELKATPGKMNNGVTGTTTVIQAELFKSALGTAFENIRYPGSPQMAQALVAGQIDFVFSFGGLAALKAMQDAGQIRVLSIHGQKRSVSFFPETPAMGESTRPELRELSKHELMAGAWFGILATAGTPRAAVDILYAASRDIARNPGLRKRIADTSGAELLENPPLPQEFAAKIAGEVATSIAVARKIGIEPQ